MVVDDVFSTIGTANMDYRSFNINFEVNALIYNKETTIALKSLFKTDLEDCEQLTLKSWRNRPKRIKVVEAVARLMAPLL